MLRENLGGFILRASLVSFLRRRRADEWCLWRSSGEKKRELFSFVFVSFFFFFLNAIESPSVDSLFTNLINININIFNIVRAKLWFSKRYYIIQCLICICVKRNRLI